MNFLLYQAYGHTDILRECLFSVLTYYRKKDSSTAPAQLAIYTDNADWFKPYLVGLPGQVHFVPVDPQLIKQWRGPHDFVHRVKICIMQDFFERWPHANLLYADTDTEFLTDCQPLYDQIAAGQFFMHEDEGILQGKNVSIMSRKTGKFVRGKVYQRSNGETFTINLSTRMHNAGVIGMAGASRHLLKDVLSLTDQLYAQFPKHTMEQLAFSYMLQSAGKLRSASDYIYHFWFLKELRPMLQQFFDRYKGRPFNELAELSAQFDPATLSDKKMDYRNLPGFIRMVLKITGRQWKIKPVDLK